MAKGLWSYFFIIVISLMGLTNFFAPLFIAEYKTNPWITYFFLFFASGMSGYKGLVAFIMSYMKEIPKEKDNEPS